MNDVSEHSKFEKKKKKNKEKGKKEKRSGGHIIKCLLTELDRAGRENIWPSVMAHGQDSTGQQESCLVHFLRCNCNNFRSKTKVKVNETFF